MKIQISIAGFAGAATTLLATYKEETGILAIAKEVTFKETRQAGCAVVSDLELPEVDYHFTDQDMRGAINAYFARNAQRLIALPDSLIRYQPDNKIEVDAVEATGRKYRIAGDISNGQVAVLAACAFLQAQNPINAAIAMMDDLADFYVTTI